MSDQPGGGDGEFRDSSLAQEENLHDAFEEMPDQAGLDGARDPETEGEQGAGSRDEDASDLDEHPARGPEE